MMKNLILISALLFSFNGWANLNLVCDGIATVESKAKGSTETCLHDPGVNPVLDPNCRYGKKITTTSKAPSEKRVPVSIDFFLNANEVSGWIDIPKSIRPLNWAKTELVPGTNKYALVDVQTSQRKIKAKIVITRFNKPTINIDRIKGIMSLSYSGTSFRGTCEKIDTSRRKF